MWCGYRPISRQHGDVMPSSCLVKWCCGIHLLSVMGHLFHCDVFRLILQRDYHEDASNSGTSKSFWELGMTVHFQLHAIVAYFFISTPVLFCGHGNRIIRHYVRIVRGLAIGQLSVASVVSMWKQSPDSPHNDIYLYMTTPPNLQRLICVQTWMDPFSERFMPAF